MLDNNLKQDGPIIIKICNKCQHVIANYDVVEHWMEYHCDHPSIILTRSPHERWIESLTKDPCPNCCPYLNEK